MSERPKFLLPGASGMKQPKYIAGAWNDFETNASGFFTTSVGVSAYKDFDPTIWGKAGWRVDENGLVTLRGLLQRSAGNVTTGDVICQLPSGIRPLWQRRFHGQVTFLCVNGEATTTTANRGLIQADIIYYAATFVVLDGIQFYIGS